MKVDEELLEFLSTNSRRLSVNTPSGGLGFFASDVANGIRKIYFNKTKMPYSNEEPYMGTLILDIGNAFHEMVEQQYKAAGIWLAAEHRIFIDDAQVTGRVDIIIEHEENAVPVEVKSISPFGFKYIMKEPKPEHTAQLQLYMHHMQVDYGFVHYINKSNCEQLIWKVDYDASVVDELIMKFKLAQTFIDKDELPPKCEGCTDKNKFPASWGWGGCRWRDECWT